MTTPTKAPPQAAEITAFMTHTMTRMSEEALAKFGPDDPEAHTRILEETMRLSADLQKLMAPIVELGMKLQEKAPELDAELSLLNDRKSKVQYKIFEEFSRLSKTMTVTNYYLVVNRTERVLLRAMEQNLKELQALDFSK
jgi:hypothetical protein